MTEEWKARLRRLGSNWDVALVVMTALIATVLMANDLLAAEAHGVAPPDLSRTWTTDRDRGVQRAGRMDRRDDLAVRRHAGRALVAEWRRASDRGPDAKRWTWAQCRSEERLPASEPGTRGGSVGGTATDREAVIDL